ncbi:MAG TPA: hypothetical protein VF954_00380 [Acidimicrobiales bacterium]
MAPDTSSSRSSSSLSGSAARLVRLCTPVPAPPERACALCHGHLPSGAGALCSGCATVSRQVAACPVVAPVSLYAVGGGLHRVLRGYKDDPLPSVRLSCRRQLAQLLGGFLADHGPCVAEAAGRRWDGVAVVPSSAGRPGPHPLGRVVAEALGGKGELYEVLAPGPVRPDHRRARRGGFVVSGAVRGARLLLVDDTWTSGARAQSAACALREAGALVAAVVPIGRVGDPGFSPEASADWERWRGRAFDPADCCVGGHARARPSGRVA